MIVSSDKDMLQLVNERVHMYNPVKEDVWYDPATAEEFMGVKPSQVADLLALKGDSIDNIPGAPGIGDKGARDLIQRFGSVEDALEQAAEVERKMYRESLQNNREQILLSKRLATIDTTVPIEFGFTGTGGAGAGCRGAEEGLQRAGVFQPAEGTGRRPKIRTRATTRTLETARKPWSNTWPRFRPAPTWPSTMSDAARRRDALADVDRRGVSGRALRGRSRWTFSTPPSRCWKTPTARRSRMT